MTSVTNTKNKRHRKEPLASYGGLQKSYSRACNKATRKKAKEKLLRDGLPIC